MDRLIERSSKIKASFLGLPPFLRFGVAFFVTGGALDLFYHFDAMIWPGSLDKIMGPDGYYAHLVLFFGMLLMVIGVIFKKPGQHETRTGLQDDRG